MYAIIEACGRQYKVVPKEELILNKLPDKEGNIVSISKVLLLVDKEQVHIGTPYLADTRVTLKILKQFKGDKIRVGRFRAKSRYRKITGFRPSLTRVVVESIKSN